MTDKKTAEFNENSMDYAGGVAVGAEGFITNFNADAQARISNALMEIAKWVDEESGAFLGHVKCGIYLEDGSGVTLNLTNLDNGVEVHGTLEPTEKVGFSILCAVLDVDKHELEHTLMHALEDTFLDIELIRGGHHHEGDKHCNHGDDCKCGGHGHKHDDHCNHGDDCKCGGHHHEHRHD